MRFREQVGLAMVAPNGVPLTIGSVVSDKYRIERVLGKGGMGVVYKAIHLTLGEPVALKFVLGEHLHDETLVARFIREAQAAVRIKSEHVARVLDVSTLPSGAPYIVMEFLQGRSLEDKLKQDGPLCVSDTANFIFQALDALVEAHALGIVHRDLKPANLFLTARADGSPFVKVLDFGVSKLSDRTGAPAGITTVTELLGSPSFMSPEQLVSAKDVDGRSDIWAVGVTMFQLLTGHLPYEGETLPQLYAAILNGSPKSLRSLCPAVPIEVEAIVLKCLANERDDRYHDVGELAVALLPFTGVATEKEVQRILRVNTATPMLGVETAPLRGADRSVQTSETIRAAYVQPLPKKSAFSSRKRMALALSTVAVFCTIAGLYMWAEQSSTPPSATRSSSAAVQNKTANTKRAKHAYSNQGAVSAPTLSEGSLPRFSKSRAAKPATKPATQDRRAGLPDNPFDMSLK